MTDLINNKSAGEINELIQKYVPVLELTKNKNDIPYLAYIIDVAVKHIQINHKEVNIDQKSWAVCAVRWQYLNGKILNDSDITSTIDEFFQYVKDELISFTSNMIAVSQYDLEAAFVHSFLHKKNRQ